MRFLQIAAIKQSAEATKTPELAEGREAKYDISPTAILYAETFSSSRDISWTTIVLITGERLHATTTNWKNALSRLKKD
jgi:hypothetical protein